MKLTELDTNDRAVSPVVGVALLIAITVILAAVIGGVVLGIGPGGVDAPQAQISADINESDSVTLNHNGGDPLPDDEITVMIGDEKVNLSDSDDLDDGAELTAGGDVSINDSVGDLEDTDFDEGTEVAVLWEEPGSDSTTVLAEFEA